MKAIAYLRFSSDDQADGSSIERQTENTAAYCKSNKLELVKTITDEGKSAFKGEHISDGNLGKFLIEADKGAYRGHALVVEQMDRLSRLDMDTSYMLIRRILKAGLEVRITQTNRVIRDLNDIVTVLINALETHGSNVHSAKLKERLLKAWALKRTTASKDKAMTSLVPSWLKAVKKEAIEIIPERAAIVKKIFHLAAQGLGSHKIANRLIADGDKPFNPKGWTTSWIKLTLRNRAVLGEFQSRKSASKEVFPDYYPAVITPSEWDAARSAVNAKLCNGGYNPRNNFNGTPYRGGSKTSDIANNLFSGIAYTNDGRTVVFKNCTKGPNSNRREYLVTEFVAGVKSERIRYERFETAFLNFLTDLDWKAVAGASLSDEEATAQYKLDRVLGDFDKLSRRLEATKAAMDADDLDVDTLRVLAAKVAEDEKGIAGLAIERDEQALIVQAAKAKSEALYSPEDLLELINATDNTVRLRLRSEIRKRISKIEFDFSQGQPVVYVWFMNGANRLIDFRDGEPVLATQRSWERPAKTEIITVDKIVMCKTARSKKTATKRVTENDQLFADFQAKHATSPITFRPTVKDSKRYAACVAAKNYASIDMLFFKDEKDLKTFIRWCLRGAPGYKA